MFGRMSSIKIFLRENKPNAKGEYPLYIQIIHDRQQSEMFYKFHCQFKIGMKIEVGLEEETKEVNALLKKKKSPL